MRCAPCTAFLDAARASQTLSRHGRATTRLAGRADSLPQVQKETRTRYVPPHLRAAQKEQEEGLRRSLEELSVSATAAQVNNSNNSNTGTSEVSAVERARFLPANMP